jgi:hypothetical protein
VKSSGWRLLSFVRIGSQLGFLTYAHCGYLYRLESSSSLLFLNHSISTMRESADTTTSRRNGLDLDRSVEISTRTLGDNSTNTSATPSARGSTGQTVPREWRKGRYWDDLVSTGNSETSPSQSTSGTVTPQTQTPEGVALPDMPSLDNGMTNVQDWLKAAKERAKILESHRL